MVGSAQESRKTHLEHLGLLKNYFACLQATMNLVHQKGTQRLQLKRKKKTLMGKQLYQTKPKNMKQIYYTIKIK